MPRKLTTLCVNRIKVLTLVFALLSLVIFGRLAQIQVFQHKKYSTIANAQHWIVQDIPAKRGRILSADGAVLATNQDYYLLYAEPKRITDKGQFAKDMADFLASEERGTSEELFAKYYDLIDNDLWWIALERKIDPATKEAVLGLGLDGLGFELSPQRFYPEGTLAAHLLGFVAMNEKGDRLGYFGIEGGLDGDLHGKCGKVIQEKDALGNPILSGGYDYMDSISGRDVTLTIERPVQFMVEKELADAVERYGAASGTVVVMDPLTGSIIALANYPTFDPSDVTENTKNLAISETYEPGSVMKPFTITTGIDLGIINPSSTFVDSGPVNYSGHIIDNWDGKHHGVQNIAQLLQKSNNIGAAWVGHQVGAKNLHKYLTSFGFGQKTGMILEGEDTGIIRDADSWTDIDLANIAFGQGISATPLQILNAFNVFANGGILYRPRIVSQIMSEEKPIEMRPQKIRKVLSEKKSQVMEELLIGAVAQGESRYFNIDGYKVAGKTGTGQIFIDGDYDPSATNATFVGFLATSKKFSMLVKLERPSASVFAAETAVPLWMDLARQLASYYAIPPDTPLL